jgi:hypothetical protein
VMEETWGRAVIIGVLPGHSQPAVAFLQF